MDLLLTETGEALLLETGEQITLDGIVSVPSSIGSLPGFVYFGGTRASLSGFTYTSGPVGYVPQPFPAAAAAA